MNYQKILLVKDNKVKLHLLEEYVAKKISCLIRPFKLLTLLKCTFKLCVCTARKKSHTLVVLPIIYILQKYFIKAC